MISGQSNVINLNSLAQDLANNFGDLLIDKPSMTRKTPEKNQLFVETNVNF